MARFRRSDTIGQTISINSVRSFFGVLTAPHIRQGRMPGSHIRNLNCVHQGEAVHSPRGKGGTGCDNLAGVRFPTFPPNAVMRHVIHSFSLVYAAEGQCPSHARIVQRQNIAPDCRIVGDAKMVVRFHLTGTKILPTVGQELTKNNYQVWKRNSLKEKTSVRSWRHWQKVE